MIWKGKLPPKREVRIGVIGAGISGLVCASTLQEHGVEVDVFDKVGCRRANIYQISREDETWILITEHLISLLMTVECFIGQNNGRTRCSL